MYVTWRHESNAAMIRYGGKCGRTAKAVNIFGSNDPGVSLGVFFVEMNLVKWRKVKGNAWELKFDCKGLEISTSLHSYATFYSHGI